MAESDVLVNMSNFELDWKGINVNIAGKHILKGLAFTTRPARLCALMGATGSGKTTLLNVLAGRLQYTGTVRYGGQPWHNGLRTKLAFVEQEDLVYSCLTVRQSLRLSARLRLPDKLSSEQKMQRVEEVITQFRMGKCADTVIGDANVRGISGGEKKRLCIMTEILTDPNYVFCDEPTSGLDSSMAVMVVQGLKQLALQGKTVISSIHQPSSPVFSLFDDLFFLHEGEVMYKGPVNSVVEYFGSFGFECPKQHNPSDFVMDLFVLEQLPPESVAKIKAATDTPDTSATPPEQGEHTISEKTHYPASFLTQVSVVAQRAFAQSKGSIITWSAFVMYVGLGVLNGFLWFRLPATENDIYNRFALALFLTGTWMFFPIVEAMAIFPSDHVMLRKELYVGSFRLSAYFLARTSVCLVPYLIWPFLYDLVVYWMTLGPINLSVGQFVCLHLAVLLSLLAMHSLGTLAGACIPERHLTTFAILFITFEFAYSGLFNATLVIWLQWISDVNPFVFGYQLVAIVIFNGPGTEDLRYTCKGSLSDFQSCRIDPNSGITGPEVLERNGTIHAPGTCVAVLLGVFVLGRVLAYFALRRRMLGKKMVVH